MNDDIMFIQAKLIENIDRLDNEQDDLKEEISRSNAISQLASTYIKTCNLIIALQKINDNDKENNGALKIEK